MSYQKSKSKQIVTHKQDLNKTIAVALEKVAAIVSATLGPAGRGVLIERDGLPPLVTKDGVTVVKSLGVTDAVENIIVDALKEVSLNTAKEAGDGTTSAIVIAEALVRHGQRFLADNPKHNAQQLVNELKKAYDLVVVPYLKTNAVSVKTPEALKQVATISANGDEQIAEAVVEAVIAAGDDGTVLLQEAQGSIMKVEKMDGYVVTSGLKELGQIGPIFVNDRSSQSASMENGYVFLYDGAISDLKPLGTLQDSLENTGQAGSPVLIFAHSFSDIVLEKLAKNMKGGVTIVPVKTPMSGLPNSRTHFLRDMAAYTGGMVYDVTSLAEEYSPDESPLKLGQFNSARVNNYETLVIASPGSDEIDARVSELKAIMAAAFSEFDRMHLRTAIGKLTGGVSTIFVGGTSDLEVREKKDRVEDAVEAVRSAIAEGVVPGGAVVHLKLAHLIRIHVQYKPSWEILAKALAQPFTNILNNCGENAEETYKEALSKSIETQEAGLPRIAYDAASHSVVDPWQSGLIEPGKVIRVSVGNALSVASLLTTLGGVVVTYRDNGLEAQLEMGKEAFKSMLDVANNGE